MKDKKKLSLGRILKDVIFMVPSLFFSVTNLTAIISAEAQLAIRSVILLAILCLLAAALLTTAWLCLLGMLFTWLLTLHLSLVISFLILFFCNVFLLLIITFAISYYRRYLSFPATSNMIRKFFP